MSVDDLRSYLSLIAPIAVTVTSLTAIVAAIFVSRQVAHLKRSREVDTFLRILEAGNHEPVRTAANWVKYDLDESLSYKEARADLEIWDKISTVEHHFEMLGILVDRTYISRDMLYDQMGPWIAGSWAKLQPLIGAHRAARKAPDYAENFEILADGYEDWAKKNPAKLEKRARASKQALQQYYKRV